MTLADTRNNVEIEGLGTNSCFVCSVSIVYGYAGPLVVVSSVLN